MAQNLDAFIKEVWAPEVQELAMWRLVARDIAKELSIPDGNDTINYPYGNDLTAGDYTPNSTSGAVASTDITGVNEQLVVSTAKYVSFKVDKVQRTAVFYNLENFYKDRAVKALAKAIDSAILAEYANAGSYIDAGDIGGTAGTSITPTTSNILDIFAQIKVKLAENELEDEGDLFMVMDPFYYATVLEKYMATNGFAVQDKAVVNGYKGRVLNFDIYTSTNLTSASSTTHWLAGKKGSTHYAIAREAQLEKIKNTMNTDGTHNLDIKYVVWNKYGKKTFTQPGKGLVDVRVVQFS